MLASAISSASDWTCAAASAGGLLYICIRSARRFWKLQRRRRELKGELMHYAKLCTTCGYDVRGCTANCSECGAPIVSARRM